MGSSDYRIGCRQLVNAASVTSSTEAGSFRFWFERRLPERYVDLLEGSVIVGSGLAEAQASGSIGAAQAIVASARVRYDAELMARVPGLRVISRTGIGLDNIAIDEATSRGIAICNVPDGPTVSTAEHAVTLLLAAAKQLPASAQALRDGRGDFFNDHQGLELDGLTLGLIGLGKIGRRVALIRNRARHAGRRLRSLSRSRRGLVASRPDGSRPRELAGRGRRRLAPYPSDRPRPRT